MSRDHFTRISLMRSPVHPQCTLQFREVEKDLKAYECPRSGGLWIPLQSYFHWRERQPEETSPPEEAPVPELQDDSGRRTLICPESGRLLLRYRVGHGLPFHLDRSPVTGGVWLDKGEWEALRSRHLHTTLHQIFTAPYQRNAWKKLFRLGSEKPTSPRWPTSAPGFPPIQVAETFCVFC